MDHPASDLEQRIAGIAALDQPLRRDLYRLLHAADGWTTRDEAAQALDLPRSVAAFHLDKLADAGVVEVRFERTSGRQGPGAGRPSKLYRPAREEVAASVPDRHYDIAGSMLATAVAQSARTGVPVSDCLHAAAHDAGHTLGVAALAAAQVDAQAHDRADDRDALRDSVLNVLTLHGYEPAVVDGEVVLANCPFHRLADEHRELVCGMNYDFLDGLLDGIGPTDRMTARLEPVPGHCCVRIAVD